MRDLFRKFLNKDINFKKLKPPNGNPIIGWKSDYLRVTFYFPQYWASHGFCRVWL